MQRFSSQYHYSLPAVTLPMPSKMPFIDWACQQPSAVSHQYSEFCRQPSIFSHQLSSVRRPPSAVIRQPSSFIRQPSAVSRQPSAVRHRKQPVTSS